MNSFSSSNSKVIALIALLLAGGAGFVIARLTTPAPQAVAAGTAPAAAKSKDLILDASYLGAVGIQLEAASRGDLGAEIHATGAVSAAPNGQAAVSAHTAGTVVRIAKQLGDSVRAGDTLAIVQSRDAAEIAAARAVAESRETLAQSNFEREKSLYEQKVTARQDFEAAQAELAAAKAQTQSARLAAENAHVSSDGSAVSVVSPMNGRLMSATTTVGAFVQADTELFRVSDPGKTQIEVAVTAADAARVTAADRATVRTAAGQSLPATVRSVTPVLDEKTRSATVVLSLDGPKGSPSPGEFVQVVITPKASGPTALVIPEEAVQRVDGRDVVFVKNEKGFHVQQVAVGIRSGGRASILSGLSEGETIATRNAFLLKAEMAKGEEEEE